MKRPGRWSLLILVALVVLAGGGALALPRLGWRARLLSMEVHGRLPGVGWADAMRALGPTVLGGSESARLARAMATNRYKSIHNPRTTKADVAAGGELFRSQCAQCHGRDGKGALGPDLTTGALRHGGSDWALFRTISEGIPGTAMPPSTLPGDSVWQVAAFVRHLRGSSPGAEQRQAFPAFWDSVEPPPVTTAELIHSVDSPADWLMYSGGYRSQRHSRLAEVRRENVAHLKLEWMYQMPTIQLRAETTPLVVGDAMYVTDPPATVVALDARTGRVAWRYERPVPADPLLEFGKVNRGVAVLGRRLFLGTLDAHLVALDARTGRVLWDVQVADPTRGYSITSAPLAVGNEVVTGVAGGENGIRGFLEAHDAETGRKLWRFETIPGPGDPGHESWSGDSWKTGGGPTWLTGSYDPDLGLIYWGVGNPGPDFDRTVREGDNLYTNSVVAVEAATGELRWYFQFTPHGDHDWDSAQIPVLVDLRTGGRTRKLLLWANRNGFFYVLDRETGQFLRASAFVKETWAARIDSSGRPVRLPDTDPTQQGSLVHPGFLGGTNWWSPTFSPRTELMYVPVWESASMFYRTKTDYEPGRKYLASSALQPPAAAGDRSEIRALDPRTGRTVWKRRFSATSVGGLLSTDGGIVFGSHGPDFMALDSRTGRILWKVHTGANILAAPIAFRSGGHERVAIASGRSVLVFGLPER
jgi:alcohol dehydrogenase (cytochrome c)